MQNKISFPQLWLCMAFLNIAMVASTLLVLKSGCSRRTGQYHSCWCPGSLRHQVISSYGIYCVQWTGPCLRSGKISATCTNSSVEIYYKIQLFYALLMVNINWYFVMWNRLHSNSVKLTLHWVWCVIKAGNIVWNLSQKKELYLFLEEHANLRVPLQLLTWPFIGWVDLWSRANFHTYIFYWSVMNNTLNLSCVSKI